MVKIGRQKNRPNTFVSPAPVGWRTLAEKVYSILWKNVYEFNIYIPYLDGTTYRTSGFCDGLVKFVDH